MAYLIKRNSSVLAWAHDPEDANALAKIYRDNDIEVTVHEDEDFDPVNSVPSPPSRRKYPYRVLIWGEGPWVAAAPDVYTARELASYLGPCFYNGVFTRHSTTGCTHWGHEIEHAPDCNGRRCGFAEVFSGHTHVAVQELDGEPYCWTYCVCPDIPHSEAAHGNIIYRQRCKCGATRLVEQNRLSWAASEWHEPDEDEAEDRPRDDESEESDES